MGLNEDNIALFDSYLRNEMNATEKEAFELSLKNSPELRKEFEEFKTFESAIMDAEVRKFKDQLSEWDEVSSESSKKSRIIPLRIITVAASVALIAFLAVNYFFNSPNHQDLADSYFSPYENVITVRGEQEAIDEALQHYEEERYESAIDLFSSYPENLTAQFYLAESQLALQNYAEARTHYQKVLEIENIFEEIATFHLALTHLGEGKEVETVNILEKIPTSSHYYEDAQRLLSELK